MSGSDHGSRWPSILPWASEASKGPGVLLSRSSVNSPRNFQPNSVSLFFFRTAFLVLMAAGVGCVGPAPDSPTERIQQRLDVCALSSDGTLCDDGIICTQSDICKGGVCVGTLVADGTPCTTGDVCVIRNSQVCKAGECIGVPAPDGYPCIDDDPCTEPDTCRGSKCIPGPAKVCDDGNMCTTDKCATGKGCVFMPIPECQLSDGGPDAPADGADGNTADSPLSNNSLNDANASVDMSSGDLPPMDMLSVDRPSTDKQVDVAMTEDLASDVGGDVSDRQSDGTMGGTLDDGGTELNQVDLRAHGGACVCAASGRANALDGGYLVLLIAAAISRRRRDRLCGHRRCGR
jgi:hypothetical protein